MSVTVLVMYMRINKRKELQRIIMIARDPYLSRAHAVLCKLRPNLV